MFQVGLPCHLGLYASWLVSINVDKTRRHFAETFMALACFPNVSESRIQETLFPVSIFVFKMQIMLTLHGREFYRNSEHASTCKNFANTSKRAIRAKAKFCEHFQIGWTIQYPYFLYVLNIIDIVIIAWCSF